MLLSSALAAPDTPAAAIAAVKMSRCVNECLVLAMNAPSEDEHRIPGTGRTVAVASDPTKPSRPEGADPAVHPDPY
jgi:hypothetical protein